LVGGDRGEGMAEMQEPGRTGGKAGGVHERSLAISASRSVRELIFV
jgi:hypothetical protein